MELAWVGFDYLGIERTTTEASVRSVVDIHLAYMPFSHSVATAVGGALLAWLVVEKRLGRPLLARAIGVGIFWHLVLGLVTHAQDIVLWPGSTLPALGLGLSPLLTSRRPRLRQRRRRDERGDETLRSVNPFLNPAP